MEESPKEGSICVNKDKALKMINYSIIIPHKNSPDLLQYCLDSIPVRDDVQVIVVDDNSDADKVDFENFPQWKGEHYEYYFTKQGKGAGYIRNVGLKKVKGNWVLFADADDFFMPKINKVFDEYVDSDVDLVFFRPKGVMLFDRTTPSKRGTAINGIIDRYLESGCDVELRCWTYSPWCRLVKTALIKDNNIRFEETRYSNDIMFSVLVGLKAESISVIDEKLYGLTYSADSLTANYNNKPGELSIRAEVFFRAQQVIFDSGYPIYEKDALWYLKKLFDNNEQLFLKYFNQMHKMGYKKTWLLKEIFKTHSKKSQIKRSIYIMVISMLKKA